MTCLICNCEMKNRQQLAYHLNSVHHTNVHDYKIKYKLDKDNNLLECPICGEYNLKQLTHHLTWKHNLTKEQFLQQFPDTKLWIDEISERCAKAQSKGIETFRNNLKDNPHHYDEMYKRRSKRRDYASIALKVKQTRKERGSDEKTSLRSKQLWQNEDYRRAQSERMKQQHKNGLTDIAIKKSGRKRYPITLGDNTYNMRSTWEVSLAIYFYNHNIGFKYEPFTIKYRYMGEIKLYYPDFYLQQSNLIIEVKPLDLCEDEKVIAKRNACIEQGYKYMFITENELKVLDTIRFE